MLKNATVEHVIYTLNVISTSSCRKLCVFTQLSVINLPRARTEHAQLFEGVPSAGRGS